MDARLRQEVKVPRGQFGFNAWKGTTSVEARCRKSVERSQKNRYI